MELELRRYNRKHLILFCGVMGLGILMIIAIVLFPNKPTKAEDSWCPNEMVTITRIPVKKNYDGVTLELDNGVAIETIVAKENHVDENRIPNNEAVKQAFLKLPYVVLSNVEGTNIKYEGYVMSSPFPNDMTSLLDYQRNKIPLCVDIVRMGVFVLYEPLELK